jgi:Protein of unknown function (DUF4435)
MVLPKYTIQEYLRYIQLSHKKHLLVEGKEDKRIFKLLFDEFKQEKKILDVDKIDIDTAEILSFTDTPRNCDRVKSVCLSIENKDYQDKLVGFIDREFSEFEYDGVPFQDKLQTHKVEGRLVWSRGHSIENYFFDFSILRDSFRGLIAIDYFAETLLLFQIVIESAIQRACAISLAAEKSCKIKRILSTIQWEYLELDNGELMIKNMEQNLLASPPGFSPDEAKQFYEEYEKWQRRVKSNTDFLVIRWLCHGHIGIKFIWSVYQYCIYHICSGNSDRETARKDAENKTKISEDKITHNLATCWSRKAVNHECDYPMPVLQLLGINLE